MSFDSGPGNDERYQVLYAAYALKCYAAMGTNGIMLLQTRMIDPAMQNYGIIIRTPER